MGYKINDDGQLMHQGVSLNFHENFLKIKSPALDGKTPAAAIHFPAMVNIYYFLNFAL